MQAAHIGNSILDEGHEALAQQVNALWDYWRHTGDRPSLIAALNAFIGQLRHHFSLEEIIIRGAGFPATDHHSERHHTLLATIAGVRNQLAIDSTLRLSEAMQDLESLLCDHELIEDSAYWPYLQRFADHAEAMRNTRSGQILQWHETYLTGNIQIDSHHRSLMYHAERLNRLAGQQARHQFSHAMHEFRALAAHHFRVEESVLAEQDQDIGQTHRLAHVGLMRSLDAMIQRVEQGKLAPLSFARDFLSFWMLNHITEGDMKDFRRLAPTLAAQTLS